MKCNYSPFPRTLLCAVLTATGLLCVSTSSQAQHIRLHAPVIDAVMAGQLREFLHDAAYDLADIVRDRVRVRVEIEPPQPRVERHGDPPQSGMRWIPGYWRWDDDSDRFEWVSGVWRMPPPDRDWHPGEWVRRDGAWVWQSGYWEPADRGGVFVAPTAPPAPRRTSPETQREGQRWISGHWAYRNGDFEWVEGRWEKPPRDELHWVSGEWIREGDRYRYVPGYWDIEDRSKRFVPPGHAKGPGESARDYAPGQQKKQKTGPPEQAGPKKGKGGPPPHAQGGSPGKSKDKGKSRGKGKGR